MEYISGSTTQPWTPAQCAFAAHELGRFNGVYLTGAPLLSSFRLSTEQCHWWLARLEHYERDRAWENLFVRAAFRAGVRPRVERQWAEKEGFLAVLNQVLRVLTPVDFQRRNLFIRTRDDGTDEVVIDWGWGGCGGLGSRCS